MKSIIISDILKTLKYDKFIGNKEIFISQMISFLSTKSKDNTISWCNDKNKNLLKNFSKGTFIISNKIEKKCLIKSCNYIIVKNPRLYFKNVLEIFFMDKTEFSISSSAQIHKSVLLGDKIYIGNNVVIEKNCIIGSNVVINHNAVIFRDTKIGNNVVVGANTTIGGIGFGYEKNKSGDFELIPHIGNVILSNNVEIGNNTTIDRAVLGSTFIGENVKVDNLVHIAHGVKIGKNSVLIANVMIAGSVTIGENVWIAPSSSVLNKKNVDDDSLIGIGAVVLKDILKKDIVVGNPARSIKINKVN